MKLHNRILVAVDPSARHQLALGRGARLAAATGAELRVQGVVFEPELSDEIFILDDDDGAVEREARIAAALERLQQRTAELDLPRVSVSANWGHPFDETMLSVVAEYGPDLLIMQPRGGVGARLNLTEWRLLRRCPSPVWLARSETWPDRPSIVAAVDPTHAGDKPASLDRDVIAAADAISRAFSTEFGVLHSIDGIPSAIGVAQSPKDYERELRAIRTKRIKELLPVESKERIEITLSSLEPARALRDYCAERKADLLAMGMLTRSRLGEWLVGSTVRQFVPRSECDVLLVKPSQG